MGHLKCDLSTPVIADSWLLLSRGTELAASVTLFTFPMTLRLGYPVVRSMSPLIISFFQVDGNEKCNGNDVNGESINGRRSCY